MSFMTENDYSRIDYPTYQFYLSATLPVYPETFLQQSFAERVRLINSEKDPISTYLVDASIYAQGPNKAIRQQAVQELTSQKNITSNKCTFSATLLVGAIAGALYGASSGNISLLVASVIGVGASTFAAYRYYGEKTELQKKSDAWATHPAQRAVDERTKAYKEGFPYAMSHCLKGIAGTIGSNDILHPFEVANLYEMSLKKTMQNAADLEKRIYIPDKEKKQWIQKILQEKLFSQEAIAYAYGTSALQSDLMQWAPAFEGFRQDWSMIEGSSSEKIKSAHQEASEEIRGIENTRNFALAAATITKNSSDDNALKTYHSKVSQAWTQKEKTEALQEYNDSIHKHNTIYTLATAPIHLIAENAISKVLVKRDAKIAEIKTWGAAWSEHFFQRSLQIFKEAYTKTFA